MYKAVLAFLLLASNATLAFSYIPNNSIRITNNNISLPNKKGIMRPLRTPSSPFGPASPAGHYTPSSPAADITSPYLDRSVLGLLLSVIPTIPLKYIIARPAKFTRTHEASPDDIIEMAAMATLGTLGITPATLATLDDEANYTDINNTVSTKTKAKIDAIIKDIMSNCKRNGKSAPEVSISNIQKYCSPSNIIKNKNTKALSLSFKKCKYALLFGEFSEYEIIEYARAAAAADSHNTYYVSLKVSAPYKTMLRNGIQFTDMYYPKTRDYNNICFVIYKLSLKKYEDGNLYIEAGTIVPPRTQF
jgi:hypothetical protein